MKNEENNAAISNLQDVVQSPDATKVHDFSANEISNIEEQDNRKKTKIPVKTKNSFQSLTKANNNEAKESEKPSIRLKDKLDDPTNKVEIKVQDFSNLDVKKGGSDCLDSDIGKPQPLPDFNKVTKLSSQMYDGVFEFDDDDGEEIDSDEQIEQEVAKLTEGMKKQIEKTGQQEKENDSEDMDYFDDDFF